MFSFPRMGAGMALFRKCREFAQSLKQGLANANHMQTRSTSSSGTTVLVIIIALLTFPLWIGILGGIFGLFAGLIGAAFGIVAGVFGAVFGALAGALGWIFDWHSPWNFHFGWWSMKFFMVVAIVALVIHLSRARK